MISFFPGVHFIDFSAHVFVFHSVFQVKMPGRQSIRHRNPLKHSMILRTASKAVFMVEAKVSYHLPVNATDLPRDLQSYYFCNKK